MIFGITSLPVLSKSYVLQLIFGNILTLKIYSNYTNDTPDLQPALLLSSLTLCSRLLLLILPRVLLCAVMSVTYVVRIMVYV